MTVTLQPDCGKVKISDIKKGVKDEHETKHIRTGTGRTYRGDRFS